MVYNKDSIYWEHCAIGEINYKNSQTSNKHQDFVLTTKYYNTNLNSRIQIDIFSTDHKNNQEEYKIIQMR